ncbi:hypothetical protein C8Q80DRAFT_1174017 [Daedaleopsis nitida]|nr:hypothetical protein C8Q80DRAFT_1174017 [Daedaleopsis nitida]
MQTFVMQPSGDLQAGTEEYLVPAQPQADVLGEQLYMPPWSPGRCDTFKSLHHHTDVPPRSGVWCNESHRGPTYQMPYYDVCRDNHSTNVSLTGHILPFALPPSQDYGNYPFRIGYTSGPSTPYLRHDYNFKNPLPRSPASAIDVIPTFYASHVTADADNHVRGSPYSRLYMPPYDSSTSNLGSERASNFSEQLIQHRQAGSSAQSPLDLPSCSAPNTATSSSVLNIEANSGDATFVVIRQHCTRSNFPYSRLNSAASVALRCKRSYRSRTPRAGACPTASLRSSTAASRSQKPSPGTLQACPTARRARSQCSPSDRKCRSASSSRTTTTTLPRIAARSTSCADPESEPPRARGPHNRRRRTSQRTPRAISVRLCDHQ